MIDSILSNKPLLAILVLVISYVFIALERVPKVVIALMGGTAVILLNVVDLEYAVHHIDWNVIFLLVGMMILVNILKHTGAITWLGIYTARRVGGNGVKLMIIFCLLTAVMSAFLDNVTTVLLLGSVTCAIAKELKINPIPFLITQAIASNIGGTATLIGDPPNIMVGSAAGFSFSDFLTNLGPIIIVMLPISIWMMSIMFKNDLQLPQEAQEGISKLTLDGIITDKPLMIKAIAIIGIVIIGFIFHHTIHQEAGTIALAGASVLMVFENKKHIWDDVEWTTIFFFVGLFIIVGSLVETGVIRTMADGLLHLTQGNYNTMAIALLWGSGILSAVVDNIPYTATMIPMIHEMKSAGHFENVEALWWALALGACLGGNGTIIGATANVVIADMAHKNGYPIRFMEFMKAGSLIMLMTLVISTAYLWFRYLM